MIKIYDCCVCGWPAHKESRNIKNIEKVTCSKECMSVLRKRPRKQITKACVICGTLVTRAQSHFTENACCSSACTTLYVSKRLSDFNAVWNKDRMTPETKEKLRNHRLGKGEGKTYTKTYGRHTHRIVAEEILGRPLRKGEVVHHEDENKRNNDPSNIKIFASQAEHARYHVMKRPINPKAKK